MSSQKANAAHVVGKKKKKNYKIALKQMDAAKAVVTVVLFVAAFQRKKKLKKLIILRINIINKNQKKLNKTNRKKK